MTASDTDDDHLAKLGQLGTFIRSQRKLAQLSQRELARLTDLSDPYVSQIERGLHQPSIRVLKALASALNVRAETMLTHAGLFDAPAEKQSAAVDTETAIRTDQRLTEEQKHALLGVYRSFLSEDR
ncbi:MAG: transcriptional regulator with XRE-family HTH domain [Acidimicrobiales bacterium]